MKPQEKYMKAGIHGFLAVLSLIELFHAQTRTRKAFLGGACGWHCHATFYHLFLEKPCKALKTQ
jgi:hypothetical protein